MPLPYRTVVALSAWAVLFTTTGPARAGIIYALQSSGVITSGSGFNNSMGSEAEDDFVANSFTVVAGGTHLTAVGFLAEGGSIPPGQSATVAIYTGSSLTDPHAGGGLVRVATGTAVLAPAPAGPPASYSVDLARPVDLPVGQVFYAGLLLPDTTSFPFTTWAFSTPLGRSFFDVGPAPGAPFNLDNTSNLTVLGGTHPVVGANVQSPGNLVLTAAATPEPGGPTALLAPATVLLSRRRSVCRDFGAAAR